jgi:hypothetical protein
VITQKSAVLSYFAELASNHPRPNQLGKIFVVQDPKSVSSLKKLLQKFR